MFYWISAKAKHLRHYISEDISLMKPSVKHWQSNATGAFSFFVGERMWNMIGNDAIVTSCRSQVSCVVLSFWWLVVVETIWKSSKCFFSAAGNSPRLFFPQFVLFNRSIRPDITSTYWPSSSIHQAWFIRLRMQPNSNIDSLCCLECAVLLFFTVRAATTRIQTRNIVTAMFVSQQKNTSQRRLSKHQKWNSLGQSHLQSGLCRNLVHDLLSV